MESLPKVVELQLKKSLRGSTQSHPDSDLLAAFSEQSLLESERKVVLQHLAQCAECREVVSFAIPRVEIQTIKIRRSFSWRPVLIWSGVAACALIVGSAVLIKYQNTHAPLAKIAQRETAGLVQSPAVPVMQAEPNTTNQKTESAATAKKFDRLESYAKLQPPPTAKDSRRAAVASKDLKVAPPAAPPPATAEQSTIEESKKLGLFGKQSVEQSQENDKTVTAIDTVAAQSASSQNGPVSTQAAPIQLKSAFADTASTSGAVAGLLRVDKSPRWTLNADGTLLRSLDTGVSWRKIVIPGNTVLLHAIATVGPQVWVGGEQGTIYYSADAGNHWLPLNPVDEGKPLADDVISIQFTSPQQGKFLTDRQQVWTTTDGGLTWIKK